MPSWMYLSKSFQYRCTGVCKPAATPAANRQGIKWVHTTMPPSRKARKCSTVHVHRTSVQAYLAGAHCEALLHECANVEVVGEASIHAHHPNAAALQHINSPSCATQINGAARQGLIDKTLWQTCSPNIIPSALLNGRHVCCAEQWPLNLSKSDMGLSCGKDQPCVCRR